MQVTILFGNGLDLGYGLNTSYFKFYEYLIGQEENNEILRNNIIFKRLKEDKDNEKLDLWKDYEVKLGNITNEIGKEDIPKFDDDKIYIDVEVGGEEIIEHARIIDGDLEPYYEYKIQYLSGTYGSDMKVGL